jgi:hypothetical protein
MKVYLGPYPDTWWTTRLWKEKIIARRHGKEFCFEVDEKDYDRVDRAVERFAEMWQSVLNVTINKIVRHRKRKIKVRIDYHDVWSADHTLALIIHPLLIKLKEHKHGSPYVDPEDALHIGKGEETDFGHSDDKIHDRWEWVLDEIIWTFGEIISEDEGMKHYYVPYADDEEVERLGWKDSKTGEMKYMQTIEEAREMGKFDPDLHKAYNDRIANGLRLFGKYYRGLWD